MSADLLERVRRDGLLVPGRPVAVLLSGGRDSTCLLDLAVRICGQADVVALHVNYGLRDEADEDEAHCAALCERLGVALDIRRPRRAGGAKSSNLQAWAREERYGAAAELASERGGDVAAGHTATDQVETILYRLASSPSRRALLGMRQRDGHLIRPLLAVTREQTAAHCRERGLGWREDPSNRWDTYARSRIRERLVPALRDVHPAAEANVLAVSAILREEAEVLDELVDEVLRGRDEIELARVRALPAALRALVLQRLADAAVGQPAPGTARRADEIAAMGDNAALDLPHGVRAVTDTGLLRFVPRAPAAGRRRTATRRAPRAHRIER